MYPNPKRFKSCQNEPIDLSENYLIIDLTKEEADKEKFTDDQQVFLNDLPNELLEKIFDHLYISGDSLNVLLVCQRWKNLVEKFHTFKTLSFFDKKRSENDYKVALRSVRRYETMKIRLQNTNFQKETWIKNILKKPLIKKNVELLIGANGTQEGTTRISLNYFHKILKTIQQVESLKIDFVESNIIKHKQFKSSIPIIEFSQLKNLNVFWRSGLTQVGSSLLNQISAANVENLRIDLEKDYKLFELQLFWKFIQENSSNLKQVYLWSLDTYGFDWSNESLYIWFHENLREGMESFLINRLSNLKEFKVHFLHDRDLITKIFREAENLEHYETNVDINVFFRRRVYPKIKRLTIWNFKDDSQKMMEIHSVFPNVEYLRFAFPELSEEVKTYIYSAFGNIKYIEIFNTERNSYERDE